MSKTIVRTREFAEQSLEIARFAIVSTCACALIAAGQMLPL